jgi:hypothetical protein
MSHRRLFSATSVLAMALVALPSAAQAQEPSIQLVVEVGRALRVALDKRITVKRVGQPVTGRLVEAVYAHDRVVLPAGTVVKGHIEKVEHASKGTRVRMILSGDFTPPRRAILQFDMLELADGRAIPIQTSATEGTERVVLRVADASTKTKASATSRAREKVVQEAKQTASIVTAPDKKERLKVAAIRALPYHPLLVAKGTTYSARVLSRLDFGSATAVTRAQAGAAPAPESILRAQLTTALGSATSRRGTRIDAVLTQPVFAEDGGLILPEGTRLMGEVTFSKRARRFHRQGQLRFLFETVQTPDRPPADFLASLYAVESGQGDRVSIDEEGGARSNGSKARFAAPALAALAVIGATHGRLDYDTDGAGPEMQYGGASSGALGGFLGLGLVGVGVNQLGRYVTVTTAAFGLARTVYSTVFAKGRDIAFPMDTPIQVQLAPGPGHKNSKQEPR